jgi:hypothetical protein
MNKFVTKIIVMIILFGVSFIFFGQGFATYLLNTGLGTISIFTGLLGGATTGETAPTTVIDFLFSLVQTIGIILVYYFIAHMINAIFIRKK